MTRGRPPKKGLDEAIPIAMARGIVMSVLQDDEIPFDFMILSNLHTVLVRVRKARRLRGTQKEMEKEFCEPIFHLRSLPVPNYIVKELWAYSRHGTWRFFQIENTGIVEICQDGSLLRNPFTVVVARTARALQAKKTVSELVKE